jgi:hypothetical protein
MSACTMEVLPLSRFSKILRGLLLGTLILNNCTLQVIVTTRARDWLRRTLLTRVNEPSVSIRLKRISPGRLGLVPERTQKANDQAVEHEGALVLLIGAELSRALAGATIDCQESATGSRLTIVRPRRRRDVA